MAAKSIDPAIAATLEELWTSTERAPAAIAGALGLDVRRVARAAARAGWRRPDSALDALIAWSRLPHLAPERRRAALIEALWALAGAQAHALVAREGEAEPPAFAPAELVRFVQGLVTLEAASARAEAALNGRRPDPLREAPHDAPAARSPAEIRQSIAERLDEGGDEPDRRPAP